MSWDNTNDIRNILKESFTLRAEFASYSKSIEKSIQNTTSAIVAMASNMLKIKHTSEQAAHEIASVLNNVNKLSDDALLIEKRLEKSTTVIETMLHTLFELQ